MRMAAFLVSFPTTFRTKCRSHHHSGLLFNCSRTRRQRRHFLFLHHQQVASLLPLDSDPFPVSHVVRQYKLTRILDRNPPLVTYEAECLDDADADADVDVDVEASAQGPCVIVKVLSLRALQSWHVLDHLNYEADLIQRLHRPPLVNFLDRFDEDLPSDRVFILVTSKPPGIPLSNLSPACFQKHRTCIFTSVLNMLEHLNSDHDPIVHANLNPHNIFIDIDDNNVNDHNQDQASEPHVACALVNFAPPTGETIDCAYVTPDSIKSGVRTHEDDVYALGITILQILTGQSPHEWHRTDWNTPAVSEIWPLHQRRDCTSLYRTLVRVLHPFQLHRVQTASQALRLLQLDDGVHTPRNRHHVVHAQRAATLQSAQTSPSSPSSPFACIRDDEAATLQITYIPMHLTQRAISSTLFTLVWTAMSLSITVSPTTAIIPRLVGGAFTYLGLSSGVHRWHTLDMHMKFMITICPLDNVVFCTIEDSFPRTGDVNTFDYTSSTRLRAAVHVETNAEDDVYVEFLCISDEGGIRRTMDLPLRRSEMYWFRDEVNHFIESQVPTLQ